MEFTNRTAVISGAASGMGLLTAQCYAELGGNVAMADINPERVKEFAEEINRKGKGRALALECDVRDYAQVTAVCDAAVKHFGGIDLLVNTAGGAELRMCGQGFSEFPDTPIEVFDWGLDVNLKGQFYFAHAAAKQMREQKRGVIINLGSITGEEGCEFNVAYATAKSAAMNGLTKSLARFGAKYGIRCCCVSPGPVLTRPGMAAMKTALGRAAEPQEIVDLILYLASDKGGFITGINVLIDGGRNIMNRC